MLLLEARPFCNWGSKLIGLAAAAVLAGSGCVGGPPVGNSPLFVSDCDSQVAGKPAEASLVVIDWTGGTTAIYPDQELAGVDLTQFPVTGGGTLADHAESFQDQVSQEVARIYCDWPQVSIAVRVGEDDAEGAEADTVVYVTQETKPDGSMDIGQGEYDPCDHQNDNSAIIYGKRIVQLGAAYTYEEWVAVFSNVIAHEVGHTLGYGHIVRAERTDVGRSIFVELMLDRHTMTEMRRAQRFVADQSNCGGTDDSPTLGSTQGASVVPTCSYHSR